jgi:hypothetical protein
MIRTVVISDTAKRTMATKKKTKPRGEDALAYFDRTQGPLTLGRFVRAIRLGEEETLEVVAQSASAGPSSSRSLATLCTKPLFLQGVENIVHSPRRVLQARGLLADHQHDFRRSQIDQVEHKVVRMPWPLC